MLSTCTVVLESKRLQIEPEALHEHERLLGQPADWAIGLGTAGARRHPDHASVVGRRKPVVVLSSWLASSRELLRRDQRAPPHSSASVSNR
eukprot:COSAG01_NODE_6657_length_3560_cov_5.515458_1_plen_91_part_00